MSQWQFKLFEFDVKDTCSSDSTEEYNPGKDNKQFIVQMFGIDTEGKSILYMPIKYGFEKAVELLLIYKMDFPSVSIQSIVGLKRKICVNDGILFDNNIYCII